MPDERVILCFGDSNTHGTAPMACPDSLVRFPRGQRWPDVMADDLGDGWQIISEGHPGRTTVHDDPLEGGNRSGAKALPVLLETHRPIDLVVIMLGTNDLKSRFSVTPWDIGRGIEQLVTIIAGSNAGPDGVAPCTLVVAPVPILETGFLADMFLGGAVKSNALAAHFKDVAVRLGSEYYDAGLDGEVDPVEGIHLTQKSQLAIGTTIAAEVRKIF